MNNNDFHDMADSPEASYWPDPVDEFELKPELYVKLDDVLKTIDRTMSLKYPLIAAMISREVTALPDGEPVLPANRAASAMRYALARVIESTDAKLEAKCMAIAVGLAFKDCSMTEIAKCHGVSKQAVSKRIREFQEIHGISASAWNKRAGTRIEYGMTNSRRTKI